jgi:hypothetical protein
VGYTLFLAIANVPSLVNSQVLVVVYTSVPSISVEAAKPPNLHKIRRD